MIRWLEKNRYVAIILTLLIAVEIFYFSSMTFEASPTGGGINLSIAYHFIVFFLLNFFLLISITGRKKIKIKYILIVISVSIIYAFTDEIHQMFVPFRNSSIQDVLTDTAGIFSSTIIYLFSKMKLSNQ